MENITIGLDLAKNVFRVHGIGATGEVVIRKALRRSQMLPFFEKLPPSLIGAEACGTSHHWARELTKLGHEVRLMPAAYVKPYVKCGKNDAAQVAALMPTKPERHDIADAGHFSFLAPCPDALRTRAPQICTDQEFTAKVIRFFREHLRG